MDYSGFTRSTNLEDQRSGQLMTLIKLLTAPMQASYYDLTMHPFEKPFDYYQNLYLKNNQPLDPKDYSQLGIDAGLFSIPSISNSGQ